MTSHGALRPQIDQRIDVDGQRIRLWCDIENLVKEHVRIERAHEQQGCGPGVADADDASLRGTPKIVRDDAQAALRRCVVGPRIKRQHQVCSGAAVHVNRQVFGDGLLDEGDESLRELSKHDARVAGSLDSSELFDDLWHVEARGPHRLSEEGLLGRVVAEEGRGGDVQLSGDVRQGGGLEALLGKDPPGGIQKLLAADGRRTAHL